MRTKNSSPKNHTASGRNNRASGRNMPAPAQQVVTGRAALRGQREQPAAE